MRTQRLLQPPNEVESSYFRGAIHQLYSLGSAQSPTKLSEHIAAHRMKASHDGLRVAMIVDVDSYTERIEHNIPLIMFPRFRLEYQGRRMVTRILEVEENRLLVWGLPVGNMICGVYEYTSGRVKPKRIRDLTVLRRVCPLPNGVLLFGIESEDSKDEQAWTRFGALNVEGIVSATTVAKGGFLFLEQLQGIPYRYLVNEDGIQDWSAVSCSPGEYPIVVVRVQDQYVFASHSQSYSRLRVVGAQNTLTFTLHEDWKGKIECLWVSPSERSLAWLVRPNDNSPYRQLYLNGELVHDGSFTMQQEDFVWAPTGSNFGARISSENEFGQEIQSIVTKEEEKTFPVGTFLREFLIDTAGKIAAYITDNGEVCVPRIYKNRFVVAEIAWNLHWTQEGGIGFNSILENVVCRTTDITELLRH